MDRSFVAKRLKLNTLSDKVKEYVNQSSITEAHLIEITSLCIDSQFSPWLTTQQAWEELAEKANI